jgi:hypothetical protein
LKTYISQVEGLLMYNPAVFLHKDQKLKAAQDTVEILQALTAGKLVLLEEGNAPKGEIETPKPEPKQEEKPETTQAADILPEKVIENQQPVSEKTPETVKPTRRGSRK